MTKKQLHKPLLFPPEAIREVIELGTIAGTYINQNDKRVANALDRLLEILLERFRTVSITSGRKTIMREFEELSFFSVDELYEHMVLACLNTGQYDRGLEFSKKIEDMGIVSTHELRADRAQFLAGLEKMDDAQQLLLENLNENSRNVWSYINLGDLYNNWQMLDENRDIRQAEEWYFKAYDLELADSNSEGWEALLQRLGDSCIEKMQRVMERELISMLSDLGIGGWQTAVQLRESVFHAGHESTVLQHLQSILLQKSGDIKETNHCLGILSQYYNHLPQKFLEDGLSPFQMVEYFPLGLHTTRIRAEMFSAWEKEMSQLPPEQEEGALFSEYFSRFQVQFFKSIDPVTKKKRETVMRMEERKEKRAFHSGRFIWMGFLKYRDFQLS